MVHNFDTMRELIDKLNYYTKLYDEGRPQISDKEWDDMYFQLQELEKEFGVVLSNSPTCYIDYVIRNELPKVEHNHPMLSLQKTKSEEEIVRFLEGHDAIAMAKMDGLTCSIKYSDGSIVSAETRGNGVIGEDITHNILWAKGVPMEIPIKDEIIIDGEIICTYKDFEEFSNEYANPRNFAAGSIRLLDSAECAKRHLTFIAWDCIKGLDDKERLSEKLYELNNLGFEVVPYIPLLKDMIDVDHIKHCNTLIQDWAKDPDFSYPIDGTVFKFDNCNYYASLGRTDHHFRGGKAFKFYDEEYESRLKDIEWSIGKTGQLTPVAIFDDIDFGDSIVNRASLHNLNIMRQIFGENPYKGQPIWVAKQNMIIPQVVRADHKNEGTLFYYDKQVLTYPDVCPICGEPTVVKDDFLYCSNPDCDGKFINHLDHFVGKKGLDIKGLSKATLQKLINWEWVTSLKDIFHLYSYQDEWAKKDGFGPKSVMNILTAIENAKECELWQFISALSIPLIGNTYAKDIAHRCATWEEFRNTTDFITWDGFGPETCNALNKYNYEEADYIAKNILHLQNSLINQNNNSESLAGKIFCITGSLTHFKNRDEATAAIEAAGGKVTSSVSKKTNYLVNNDRNSTSSKNVKAQSLNIPIISEDELIAML